MKIGPIDGSVEEVRDFFENNGLKIDDYLEKPPVALKIRFLIIPGALFVLSLICLAVISGQHPQYISRILYIITFGSSTWLCASTQLRFKNNLATFCVAIGLILTALIAAGILSPKEAADYIKGLKEK